MPVSKLSRTQSMPELHVGEKKAPRKEYRKEAYKANVIDKLATKLKDFFYLNCTKLGKLEKQEQKIVKNMNKTMTEIMTIEKKLTTKQAELPWKERYNLNVKAEKLFNIHEAACRELNIVTNKIQSVRHETEGVQTVEHRLKQIQKMFASAEAKVKSPLDVHKGKQDFDIYSKILGEFYHEYNDVFVKNPKLHEKVSALVDKAVEGDQIYGITKELILQKQILKENKELLTIQKRQKDDYTKRWSKELEMKFHIVEKDKREVEVYDVKAKILDKRFKEADEESKSEIKLKIEKNKQDLKAAKEKLDEAHSQAQKSQKELLTNESRYDELIESTESDIALTEASIHELKKELKEARRDKRDISMDEDFKNLLAIINQEVDEGLVF